MIAITLMGLLFFVQAYIAARAEVPSYNSGTNLAVTTAMVLTVLILASFTTLTITLDENRLRVKFGYGLFHKTFSSKDVVSVKIVKNHWYYGWGIRVWFWPYMWIYNIDGLDAVEISLYDGGVYRIGTDTPRELEKGLKTMIGNRKDINSFGFRCDRDS